MARSDEQPRSVPAILATPQIRLAGDIDETSVERFVDQLSKAEAAGGDVVLELSTLGGDAEMARRIALEIGLARERLKGRFLFLGKTVVYSAGTTIMSAFPRADRWVTADTMLMIHCRKLEKTVELSGPIRTSIPEVQALLQEMEVGVELEGRNFRNLIDGSDVEFEELWEKALHNWYLDADEALQRGLVGGIWRKGAGE